MQESLLLRKPQRFLVPTVLWLVVSALGCVLVAWLELGRLRDDFQTNDRIAHLLLALRSDEAGFATVANCAFSGARWRVRRRLPAAMRPALDRAGAVARGA